MGLEILGRETTHAGYLKVERLRVRLADGSEVDREVARQGDAVAVLPYDPVARIALVVRLFRAPVFDAAGEPWLEEACAGMIEDGDAEAAGRREAEEELGLALGDLEFAGRVWSSPGVSAERVSLYLAAYAAADRTSAGGGLASEHENITVVERPLAQLGAAAKTAEIADAKLYMLVMALQARRPDLFATG